MNLQTFKSLHTQPQIQNALVVDLPFARVITNTSVQLGCSFFPLSGTIKGMVHIRYFTITQHKILIKLDVKRMWKFYKLSSAYTM